MVNDLIIGKLKRLNMVIILIVVLTGVVGCGVNYVGKIYDLSC